MADRDVTDQEISDAMIGKLSPEETQDVVSRMSDAIDDLESELEEVRESRDMAEREAETLESDAFNVLRAVRDWFDNVLLHKRPMSDPRVIWKQVERALQAGGEL